MVMREQLDKLTHEADMLREMVLKLLDGKKLTASETALVNKNQIVHRKEDLKRLEKFFRAVIEDQKAMGRYTGMDETFARFGKVLSADPRDPLEPQLGFDPDAF
jgi:hypothetical protein